MFFFLLTGCSNVIPAACRYGMPFCFEKMYPKDVFLQSTLSVVVTNDGVKQLVCLAASEAQLSRLFQVK